MLKGKYVTRSEAETKELARKLAQGFQGRDGTQDDHFFYVKLRAFEHALQYKETGRAPERSQTAHH